MSTYGPPTSEEASSTDTAGGHRSRELGRLVRSGVGWKGISQIAGQILAFATSVMVAHFLTPREVGLVAEALVFSSLSLVIGDAGLAAAVVQKPNLSEDDKTTAFWASVAIGVLIMVAGVGLSWPIAHLYGEPRVQVYFAAISPAFLFTAVGIVQGALLTRELKFRSLELRTVIASLASTVVTVVLAVLGAGSWALVGQILSVTSVSTALLWRSSDWRPRLSFAPASLRSMAPFSGHVLGARTVTWARTNLDNLLIGRYLGAASLGAYSIAFNLMVTPVTRVASPVAGVFFPAFSRMRDPVRIGAFWLRAVRLVAAGVVPAMLALMVVAPDFIEVLFGQRWHEAAPVLRILAPVGMIQALQALNAGILQSTANTRTLFRYTLFATAAAIASFVAGLPWGIVGVATAYALASIVIEPPYLVLTARAIGVPVRAWLNSVRGVLEAGIGMAVVLLAVRIGLVHLAVPPGARLAALIVLGCLVYPPLLWWRSPEIPAELRAARAARSAPQTDE
jgi:O-antigen/teichoic acid export membrane protein